jgi:hypothetical protein
MRRLARLLVPALALLGSVAVAAPAHAVDSLAYTFVVPCASSANVVSLTGLPSGTYAATIAGDCAINAGSTNTGPITTPCLVAGVTLPCVIGPTVANQPGVICHNTTSGVVVSEGCLSQSYVVLNGCASNYVEVAGQCLTLPTRQAGLVTHPGGPMSVRFVDTYYGDNLGAFLVTVVWLP